MVVRVIFRTRSYYRKESAAFKFLLKKSEKQAVITIYNSIYVCMILKFYSEFKYHICIYNNYGHAHEYE